MEIKFHSQNNKQIAEIRANGIVINETQDPLDIMADASYNGASGVVIHEHQLTPEFFDLAGTYVAYPDLQETIGKYKVQAGLFKKLTGFFGR